MRRRVLALVIATSGLVHVAASAAAAKYRGTDVLGNISPESLVGGSLVDRYPLSAFSLDYHTDVGVTDLGGVPPTIAHWAAAQIWSLTSFLVKGAIDLFTWAFSLDLLSGDPARSGDGALAPVSDAVLSLYEHVIGQAWMVAAIVIAGMWGIWKALVQRRYTETAGALAVSVLFVLIALFFVYQPERTIGQASQWTNTLSLAFLSGANRGTVEDPAEAKRQVADQLFAAQVYEPWVVLQFGGLRHCVDTGRTDEDGFPLPVGPHDPARDVCRDHLRVGRDGHGGYAPRFLRYPAGSEERAAEYEAIKSGEKPNLGLDPQFDGWEVDRADAPAVDIQQSGGAYQRLTLAVVVFLGALGMVVLLGFLSLAVILAAVVALVLLGFAPVALVIGIFPGGGHDFFRSWLVKLATAVFIKALYSLVIAVVVAVSAALAAASESLGFLFAFVLQAIFFWAIFLYRKQITARLVAATTGAADMERQPRMRAVKRGADAATRPFHALLTLPGRRGGSDGGARQESALAGGGPNVPGPAEAPQVRGHDGVLVPVATGGGRASGDPSRNGRAPSGAEVRVDQARPATMPHGSGNGSSPPAGRTPAPASREPAPEQSPRAAHEDVLRRARELRDGRGGDGASRS
jgi:hypothetical protein